MGRRLPTLLAVMAIAGAACGAGTTEPTRIDLGTPGTEAPSAQSPTTIASEGTQAPPTTTQGTGRASTSAPAPERQKPEGPDAPDFELALGGPGGTFSLSGEAKPVFMVFWAEW